MSSKSSYILIQNTFDQIIYSENQNYMGFIAFLMIIIYK